jgi:hypothetical protein
MHGFIAPTTQRDTSGPFPVLPGPVLTDGKAWTVCADSAVLAGCRVRRGAAAFLLELDVAEPAFGITAIATSVPPRTIRPTAAKGASMTTWMSRRNKAAIRWVRILRASASRTL